MPHLLCVFAAGEWESTPISSSVQIRNVDGSEHILLFPSSIADNQGGSACLPLMYF